MVAHLAHSFSVHVLDMPQTAAGDSLKWDVSVVSDAYSERVLSFPFPFPYPHPLFHLSILSPHHLPISCVQALVWKITERGAIWNKHTMKKFLRFNADTVVFKFHLVPQQYAFPDVESRKKKYVGERCHPPAHSSQSPYRFFVKIALRGKKHTICYFISKPIEIVCPQADVKEQFNSEELGGKYIRDQQHQQQHSVLTLVIIEILQNTQESVAQLL